MIVAAVSGYGTRWRWVATGGGVAVAVFLFLLSCSLLLLPLAVRLVEGVVAAVMRWFRRRLQRWSWRKTVSVSCGRGRKKKKKNLQKLGEDAGFLLTLDPNFSPLRSSTEILFIGGVRGPYCLYWGKFSALDSTRGIQTVGSKCAPRAAKFGSSRP